jgi:hypothetical protein
METTQTENIINGNKTRRYYKKPDMNTNAGKLWLAQQKGLKDSEAARSVGITPENVPATEATKTYQAIQERYADKIKEAKPMNEVIKEHIKIIEQDADRGAKLNAVKLYIERVEPETTQQQAQQINIVLSDR